MQVEIARVRVQRSGEPIYHVHKHGCRDLLREELSGEVSRDLWIVDRATRLGVVAEIYDPENFDYDPADPEAVKPYLDDVRFFHCTTAGLR